MNFIKKLFTQSEESIVKEYLHCAQVVGDMESYSYVGVPVGYENWRNNLAIVTRKIRNLGYIPFNQDQRIKYGGYGQDIELRKRDG